ncbi:MULTISPECIES: O-antigen ligase family protein [Clostridium]|uniref:O-antigen ligase family protein n=1 Tax=Clostridium TaxID=1485 RepID=UPI00189D23D2|nr:MULTISPECIES: O-antigen ligase family protein [Clostridium]MDB2119320.1 O-antigen ligase family protein [Clostridium paraputrificum]MDU2754875.1 O-antigen ligase family protein [Clostridium sp.]MDU2900672.1 O-antigen ligase family protein [Clostridium sp.]MDU4427796.1 O-antigen ligase family protein [Clostridium sp.]MDU7460743.1 O-antigen ligase family protein [Clostridium sp.]
MEVNLKKIGYVLISIPFFLPAYFYLNQGFASAIKIYKYAMFIVLVILYLKKRIIISKPGKIILLYLFFILILGIFNKYFSLDILLSIFICLLFEYGLKEKKNYFLEGLYKILEILIYVNLLSVIIFPNGMYEYAGYSANWLLGYKNPMIRIFLPACAIGLLISYKKYGKFNMRSLSLVVASIITVILVDSSTGIMGLVIFIGILLVTKMKFFSKYITLFRAFVTYIIVNFFVITGLAERYIGFLIEGILHRSMTFTGRTTTWQNALEIINKNIWSGIGDYSPEMMLTAIGGTHPHNYFLYILLQSGIIGVLILLFITKVTDKAIKKIEDKRASNIIVATIISFYVMGITESLTGATLMYPMYIILGNMNRIKYNKKNTS